MGDGEVQEARTLPLGAGCHWLRSFTLASSALLTLENTTRTLSVPAYFMGIMLPPRTLVLNLSNARDPQVENR